MMEYTLTKAVYEIAKENGFINKERMTCLGYPFHIHAFDVPLWAHYLRDKGITVKDKVFLK